MHYYLYQITNLVNNKIYVGVHKTKSLADGYMGSGKVIKRAIEKYGLENFRKDILEFFSTSEEMYAREKEVVTEEFLLREDVYNLRRGGHGGFDYINLLALDKHSDVYKKRKLGAAKGVSEGGKKIQKMLTKEERKRRAKKAVITKKSKGNLLNGLKKAVLAAQSDDAKRKRKETKKHLQVTSTLGYKWMHNEDEELSKFISEEKINEYILLGWNFGKLKKNNKEELLLKENRKKLELEQKQKQLSEWYKIYERVGFKEFVKQTGYSKSCPALIGQFKTYVKEYVPQNNGKRRGT